MQTTNNKVKEDIIFRTSALFKSVEYDNDADSWSFGFADNLAFFVPTLWRFLDNKIIKLVSNDHGHQFGLPNPIDLIKLITEALYGQRLSEIKIKKDTADLLLTLTNNLQIEIFISSSGYESYNFTIDNKQYIGMGAGDIAIFPVGY